MVGYLTAHEQKLYKRKYMKPRIDPQNLTVKDRLVSFWSLIFDGGKYILKRIIK